MQLMLIIGGAVIGLFFASGSDELLGLCVGATLGYLLAQLRRLQAQVRQMDKRLRQANIERRASAQPVEHATTSGDTRAPAAEAGRETGEDIASEAVPAKSAVAERQSQVPIATKAAPTPSVANSAGDARTASPLDKLFELAKGWLTTGNVPVKLGVIVSFFGVAFLLRYAVDQGYFVISIEARYLAVTALAAVLLAIGWRLRTRLPVYGLSMQGGGIGILYLTIFAAFRLHQLVPSVFAFMLLVVLTAAAGILAVIQNSMVLAVLGTVGGFLAPILVSTGSGNHVALFSYYLLLNAAVLGIAWYRPWRFLNVLGFVFTFGVATLWGYEYYRPALFVSTEPFLIAFFLFYQAIAILFALRQPPRLRGFVDGTLVFGTPVIAFALQSQLVADTEYGLAISAVAAAIFYTFVATWLHRRQNAALRMLIESFIALSVAFATVAVPLALDDRWTAAAWALEGAALIWIGVRQGRLLAKLAGTILLGAAGLAFIEYGWKSDRGMPLLNGNFLGGMLIAVTSLFSARYLAADDKPHAGQAIISAPMLVWGLLWWGGTGGVEIFERVDDDSSLHILTVFAALSVAALAWLGRHYDWTAARRATLAYLPTLPILAILYLFQFDYLLAGAGTLAWLLAMLAHLGLLRAYDTGEGRIEGIWHFAGVLFLAAFVGIETYLRLDLTNLSETWANTGLLLVAALLPYGIVTLIPRIAWPLQRYRVAYLGAAGVLIAVHLLAAIIVGINDPGDPRPLPYIPILNPLDILTVVGLAIALYLIAKARVGAVWLGQDGFRMLVVVWSCLAFILSTIAVVRGVHHLGDVPWQNRTLTNSVSVQSALSIYWAILGFGGMIWGARKQKRAIWIVGTGLMALVVIKLFMIDLGNTGTVARIVSFLGVGALLLVVGYYAPAPPRVASDKGA